MIHPLNDHSTEFNAANHLWANLIERLGTDRACKAVNQALDLQRMNGNSPTLPVLLYETCGIALANIDLVRKKIGFSCYGKGMILILSTKDNLVQLLHQA